MLTFHFIIIAVFIEEYKALYKKLKWTNLEIFETASNPKVRMVNFWDKDNLVDSFYIDENGKPVKHTI